MKPRHTRLPVVFAESPIFFLTCCTHQRKSLLANEPVHRSFINFCDQAHERQIFAGRFVIMPNHLHFFVYLPNSDNLPIWIKSLKNTLSKTLREHGFVAPHWQKNYFDHVLRSSESYDSKWNYVRQNPVRYKLVTDEADWPFQGEITPLSFD